MSIVISWGLMALLEIVDTTSVRSVVNLDDLGALTGTGSWATDRRDRRRSLPLSPRQPRG